MSSPKILADYLEIGINTIIEPSAVIRGINGNAKRIIIGDNVYIGESVQIICDDFEMGDYGKIHHHTNIHGYKPCKIGHNIWVGQYCILDTIGGLTIGNNCAVGAQTQLWSHIKFGDTLEGCRFLSDKPLSIGDDVYFSGKCVVSPVNIQDKAMALAGSVITKDMEFNTIYAGVPAMSVTDKLGYQFDTISVDDKYKKMIEYLSHSGVNTSKIKIVRERSEAILEDNISYFIVATREYTKKLSDEEIFFMKFLLPEKAKFTPL
ncbi:acyltransferase [Acidiluteibacter ferrifornacis]|uniref:Uncharacterized protein n=1 Tax=Acidiluteibacter ferrifornacis TaxID=2692424 RepID=A0A6N9NJK0_9FLAO|nr:DapH/DapD/GlmU-related protein [Acidiluteibacter ferrifornacis]NBG65370.1 hypothetical protein [Acidiluteibacter ferrifornacis]